MQNYSNDINQTNIEFTKSNILNAYALLENGDWAGVDTEVAKAVDNFTKVTNDVEFVQNKEYNVSKSFVLLKELQNSLALRDSEVFYIKYKNFIQEMSNL